MSRYQQEDGVRLSQHQHTFGVNNGNSRGQQVDQAPYHYSQQYKPSTVVQANQYMHDSLNEEPFSIRQILMRLDALESKAKNSEYLEKKVKQLEQEVQAYKKEGQRYEELTQQLEQLKSSLEGRIMIFDEKIVALSSRVDTKLNSFLTKIQQQIPMINNHHQHADMDNNHSDHSPDQGERTKQNNDYFNEINNLYKLVRKNLQAQKELFEELNLIKKALISNNILQNYSSKSTPSKYEIKTQVYQQTPNNQMKTPNNQQNNQMQTPNNQLNNQMQTPNNQLNNQMQTPNNHLNRQMQTPSNHSNNHNLQQSQTPQQKVHSQPLSSQYQQYNQKQEQYPQNPKHFAASSENYYKQKPQSFQSQEKQHPQNRSVLVESDIKYNQEQQQQQQPKVRQSLKIEDEFKSPSGFDIINFKQSKKGSIDYSIKYNDRSDKKRDTLQLSQSLPKNKLNLSGTYQNMSLENTREIQKIEKQPQTEFDERKRRIDEEYKIQYLSQQKEINRRIQMENARREQVIVQDKENTTKISENQRKEQFKNTPLGTEKSREKEILNRLHLERRMKDEKISLYNGVQKQNGNPQQQQFQQSQLQQSYLQNNNSLHLEMRDSKSPLRMKTLQ